MAALLPDAYRFALLQASPRKDPTAMAVPAARRRKSPVAPRGADARRVEVSSAPLPDRRATILEAATQRFAEYGFEATTVRQIGDDVNILSGSLYHHFANKDEMLHEIVRDPVQQLRKNALRIAQAPIDAEQRLIALILLDLGELTRHQKVHAILANERRLFRQNGEFAYVQKGKKDTFRAWRNVLQEGIDAGLFRPETDIFLTIFTVIRMLTNAADWFRNDEAHGYGSEVPYDLDKVIDFHLSFILSAIRTPAREAEPIRRATCEDLARIRD
jgi:TetR/AcrR family transcriptional regulator, cholesterol catabolism regulator